MLNEIEQIFLHALRCLQIERLQNDGVYDGDLRITLLGKVIDDCQKRIVGIPLPTKKVGAHLFEYVSHN